NTLPDEPEIPEPFAEMVAEAPVPEAKPETKAEEKKAEKKATPTDKFVETLYKTGLLIRYKGGRYRFRHPNIAAYLASQSLFGADENLLTEKMNLPAWRQAITYSASHAPLDHFVDTRMS